MSLSTIVAITSSVTAADYSNDHLYGRSAETMLGRLLAALIETPGQNAIALRVVIGLRKTGHRNGYRMPASRAVYQTLCAAERDGLVTSTRDGNKRLWFVVISK